jgi:hypothetical protein
LGSVGLVIAPAIPGLGIWAGSVLKVSLLSRLGLDTHLGTSPALSLALGTRLLSRPGRGANSASSLHVGTRPASSLHVGTRPASSLRFGVSLDGGPANSLGPAPSSCPGTFLGTSLGTSLGTRLAIGGEGAGGELDERVGAAGVPGLPVGVVGGGERPGGEPHDGGLDHGAVDIGQAAGEPERAVLGPPPESE